MMNNVISVVLAKLKPSIDVYKLAVTPVNWPTSVVVLVCREVESDTSSSYECLWYGR